MAQGTWGKGNRRGQMCFTPAEITTAELTREAVVDRLRESWHQSFEDDPSRTKPSDGFEAWSKFKAEALAGLIREAGLRDGREWARGRASYMTLARLAENWEWWEPSFLYLHDGRGCLTSNPDEREKQGEDFFGSLVQLCLDLNDLQDLELLGQPDGAPLRNPTYLRGFFEGALEVWDDVRDEMPDDDETAQAT
jgi:hypothetical protein